MPKNFRKQVSLQDRILDISVGNPLTSYLLNSLTNDCPKCKGSVLGKLLRDNQNKERLQLCNRCSIFYYLAKSLNPLMGWLGFRFERNNLIIEPIFKTWFKSPYYIKSTRALIKGANIFGLVKPMVASVPLAVTIEFTRLCNLDCSYCYLKKPKSQISEETCPSELSYEDWVKCLDILDESGVAMLIFSGGEALLRKDFFSVVEYASRKKFGISLATNGMLLDRDTVKRLKSSGVEHIAISIFSPNMEINDTCRGKGSFEKSICAAKYCAQEGLSVGLALTLVNKVKDQIGDFFELAKSTGVDIVTFLNFIPVGNASMSTDLDLSPCEREAVLKSIATKSPAYEKFFRRIAVLQSPHISKVLYDMAEDKEKFEVKQIGVAKYNNTKINWANYMGGCAAGRFLAAIAPNGDILPCPFLRIKLGNMLVDNFIDVWKSNPTLNKIRDRKNWKGRCGQCEFKIVCGGCRARAYAYQNDFLKSDPGCFINTDLEIL